MLKQKTTNREKDRKYMWKKIYSEKLEKLEKFREIQGWITFLDRRLDSIEETINREITRETKVYLKKIGRTKAMETGSGQKNFDVCIEMRPFINHIKINLLDGDNDKKYSFIFSNIHDIIQNLKTKVNMVNGVAVLTKSAGNYSKITFDIINNNFIIREKDLYLENFTGILSRMAEILLFIDYRFELHKNHDIISTKQSVYYLLKHFKSPGSTLSHFPKDIIIYICKKALIF